MDTHWAAKNGAFICLLRMEPSVDLTEIEVVVAEDERASCLLKWKVMSR